MSAPDKCPKCGANRRLPKIYLDPVFDCGSHIECMGVVESRRCIERQRDQLAARVKRLEEALVSIQEYWNRDENERAMSDACWHAINTAAEALEAKEPHP